MNPPRPWPDKALPKPIRPKPILISEGTLPMKQKPQSTIVCVDCKFFKKDKPQYYLEDQDLCARNCVVKREEVNNIDGKNIKYYGSSEYCRNERRTDTKSCCGPEGKFFEPKPKRFNFDFKSIWAKIVNVCVVKD